MLTVFSPISYKLFLQVNLLFGEHGEYMLCTEIILNVKNNFCTQQVLSMFWNGIFMYWTCNSMNNLLLYCGLVGAKIRASDKDLPVLQLMMKQFELLWWIEMIPNMTQMLMRILTNQQQLMLFLSLPYFWLWWHPVIQVLQDQNTLVFGCFKSFFVCRILKARLDGTVLFSRG